VNLLILSPSVSKTDSDDKIIVSFSFQTGSDNNNKKKFQKKYSGARVRVQVCGSRLLRLNRCAISSILNTMQKKFYLYSSHFPHQCRLLARTSSDGTDDYCRFVLLTGSDGTNHCGLVLLTGSDVSHHCQFVVRTDSDDASLYIG
jgi:hypothetical protein